MRRGLWQCHGPIMSVSTDIIGKSLLQLVKNRAIFTTEITGSQRVRTLPFKLLLDRIPATDLLFWFVFFTVIKAQLHTARVIMPI